MKLSSNRDSRGCTRSLARNHFSLEDIGTEQSILKRVFRIFLVLHNREDSLLHCCSMPSAKFDECLPIAVPNASPRQRLSPLMWIFTSGTFPLGSAKFMTVHSK